MKFTDIGSMHSDLIGVDEGGSLSQWKWSETEPWFSHEVGYGVALSLGLRLFNWLFALVFISVRIACISVRIKVRIELLNKLYF